MKCQSMLSIYFYKLWYYFFFNDGESTMIFFNVTEVYMVQVIFLERDIYRCVL